MTEGKEVWIKTGYEVFALSGHNGLKVEPLAKKVNKNKSSFYHYFADLELFVDELLKYHIAQSYIIAEKEQNAKNIDPELIEILIEHKIDLLFNRQLRVGREIKLFADTLEQSNKIVGNSFVLIWVKDLNLKLTQMQLEGLFELALENFFLKINLQNLNMQWLKEYFSNLKRIAVNFN